MTPEEKWQRVAGELHQFLYEAEKKLLLCRAAALEEAAKACDDLAKIWREHDPSIDSAYRNAAAAIRALTQEGE
jgi:hypothetical protein